MAKDTAAKYEAVKAAISQGSTLKAALAQNKLTEATFYYRRKKEVKPKKRASSIIALPEPKRPQRLALVLGSAQELAEILRGLE